MHLNITTHHLDLTPGITEHLEEKIAKITKHFDKVIDINVILEVEKNTHKAEASLHMSGHDVFAKAEDSDLYNAMDRMINKLDHQVLKHKEKIQAHR